MWHVFNKRHNEELELDKEVSFYCGDQAGRPASDIRPADSSSSDLLFGRNIGLRFHSPESLFLGEALELPPSSQSSSDSDGVAYASPEGNKGNEADSDSDSNSQKISTAMATPSEP